jgi:hypothetical protein
MVNTKKTRVQTVIKYIIYLYLIIFPFGQLLRWKIVYDSFVIRIQPIDLVVALSALLYVFGQIKENQVFRKMLYFLFAAAFSLSLSLTVFSPSQVFVGSLYLFRLFVYSTFFLLVLRGLNEKLISKNKLIDYLVLTTCVVGLLGWTQYFLLPDVRFLRSMGWDDHYFRIIGTFFDPTFVGILLVFGFLVSVVSYIEKSKNIYLIAASALFVSVMFTYARAAYLAMLFGTIVIFYKKKILKLFVYISLIFLLLLLVLPRPSSEGVKLERIHSINQKKDNYLQTIQIIKKHPLFGVGFNNLCAARLKYIGDIGYSSHSCSGSDSSILFVMSTTGIVGLLLFIRLIGSIYYHIKTTKYKEMFFACAAALLVHSLFVNSLFYPWVMGYLAILYAIAFTSRLRN